jgi:hypothetical protein
MAGTISLLGCKKTADAPAADTDTTSAEDHTTAELLYNDAYNVVDDAAQQNGLNKTTDTTTIISGCTTVTIDTTGGGRTMVIDFGTGCTGNDGRTRTGKINVSMTGRYHDKGTVKTISFDNYTVNGYAIEGTKTVTNEGKNADGHPYFTIKVTGGKITTPDKKVITWESSRVREWTKGYDTKTPFDDEYSISGTADGVNRNGKSYTAVISDPLQVHIGCRWIESGTLTLKPEDKAARSIDYGNGSCDNEATVTINNKTYNITLH